MRPPRTAKSRNRRTSKNRPIKDISTPTSLEDLERLRDKGAPRIDLPDTLPIREVHVANRVFQWRDQDQNVIADREHTKDLMRIVAEGKTLDPILVTPIGEKVFVVDGHHRLTAYRSQGWKGSIPVRWCLESIESARQEALAENSKNKLPMTKGERMEAAWELVKTRGDGNQPGGLSKEALSDLAGVSPQQVGLMRKTLKKDPERLRDLSWREVLRGRWKPEEAWDSDGWRQARVAEVRQVIDKHLLKTVRRDPDILCDALEALDPTVPTAMVGYWLEYAKEVLEDYEAEAPDDLDI